MDMLYISDLYKRFSDKKVLNGLNLSVPEHSIFGFIGKNGAGKTTTMKMVLGLLKADAGEIIVNQRIIAGNAQFTGIAAGRGVGFTTGLLLLREGLGMRETPIRPHSWH